MKDHPHHTPGPWKIGAHYASSEAQAYDVLPWADQAHRICRVRRSDEAYANARLIAAAPTLLAALRQIMAHEARYHESVSYLIARAAIRAAEGAA